MLISLIWLDRSAAMPPTHEGWIGDPAPSSATESEGSETLLEVYHQTPCVKSCTFCVIGHLEATRPGGYAITYNTLNPGQPYVRPQRERYTKTRACQCGGFVQPWGMAEVLQCMGCEGFTFL
jgi:hypothetical protein